MDCMDCPVVCVCLYCNVISVCLRSVFHCLIRTNTVSDTTLYETEPTRQMKQHHMEKTHVKLNRTVVFVSIKDTLMTAVRKESFDLKFKKVPRTEKVSVNSICGTALSTMTK